MISDHVDVLAPNFKRRLSGVTATVVRLVPLQARDLAIAAVGPSLPPNVPQVRCLELVWMARRGPHGPRVWHARRNNEMIIGLLLKYFLCKQLRLLFTSASQRKHTWVTRWLIAQMDAVISTSKATAAYIQRSSTVIHHGIDLATFTPVPDRADLKAQLGLPQQALVGCYGRIRPQKGTDVFVASMVKLLPHHPGVIALVMGRTTPPNRPYLLSLRQQVRLAGLEQRILFLPEVSVDRMADWYRVLHLYVAPQRWEGFGLTPLEAMACEVPVVATRTGVFDELLVDGDVGYLVPPDNVSFLVDRCARLLASERLRSLHAQRSRKHVQKYFSITAEADALNSLYRQLLCSSTQSVGEGRMSC